MLNSFQPCLSTAASTARALPTSTHPFIPRAPFLAFFCAPRLRVKLTLGTTWFFLEWQTESGVSREEVAQCLVEVAEGEAVSNRLALRELRRELREWPDLQPAASASAAAAAGAAEGEGGGYESPGLDDGGLAKPAANPQVGREGEEKDEGGLASLLPDWMGYGVLYSLSIVPIIITVGAIAVLWVSAFSG